jgi:hypothetical protein
MLMICVCVVYRGYPPEASARDDGEDGVTVMEGEERRLRISASGPVSESEEESLSSTRVQPRGTVSDTDISMSRDMRAAQVGEGEGRGRGMLVVGKGRSWGRLEMRARRTEYRDLE